MSIRGSHVFVPSAAALAVLSLCAASSYGVGIETIYTKFAGASTSQIPSAVDINGAAVTSDWRALESFVLSPGGALWVLKGRTNLGSDLENTTVIGSNRNGQLLAQEGQTAPGGQLSDRFEFFGPTSSTSTNPIGRFDTLNHFAFSATARNAATGSTDAVNGHRIYHYSSGTFTILAKQNDPCAGVFDTTSQPGGGAPGDELLGTQLGSVSMLDNGNVAFMDAAIQNVAFTLPRGLFFHDTNANTNTLYHQCGGTDTVTNYTNTGTNTFTLSTGVATDRFIVTPSGSHAMFIGTIVGSPSRNVLVRDNRVILQNGSPPAPGVANLGTVTNFELLSDGHWMAWGTYAAQGGFWALKDGYLVARTGDPIFTGSGETWGSSIRFVTANRNGDVLVAGTTSAATTSNEVVVLNGTSVIVRKGDMVDADNDGVDNDNVFIGRANLSGAVLTVGSASDTNYLYMISNIRNGAGADLNGQSVAFDPNAFLRVHFNGSCSAADFNHSGNVDFFDYLDYVDAFSAGNLRADFNADGTIDFFDYLDFVDAFGIGC